MKTIEEILMEHQERMAEIRRQDRQQTMDLAQINTLGIHGHSQEAIDKVKQMRDGLLKKLDGTP